VLAASGTSAGGEVAPAQKVATRALVLDVPEQTASGAGLVLLAVSSSEAALLSGASAWTVLSAVLVR
jgi:hypothetical protein